MTALKHITHIFGYTMLLLLSITKLEAQTDTVNFAGFYKQLVTSGTISITQDSSLERMIMRHTVLNKNDINLSGWRIQIYTSSGKEARDIANEERSKFMNKYENIKAYMIYQPPFFKIRVGDFRTKQEAFSLYKLLLVDYPASYLVQEKINLPPL